jgi:uncharacterized protein YbjT (DUF2867 family)
MKILLTGASGFVGRHLLQALVACEHEIIALYHHHKLSDALLAKPNVMPLQLDFSQMRSAEEWLPYLQDVDGVINSTGIIAGTAEQFEQVHYQAPRALFSACQQANVKRVIQISALGVEQARTPYQVSKLAADEYLQQSDLDTFVLRPSLIYGEGGKSFGFFKTLANSPVIVFPEKGRQQLQPIHISDIVAVVLRCLDDDVKTGRVLNLVGAESVTYKEWLMRLRTCRMPPLLISLPLSILMPLSRMGKKWLPLFSPDNLTMLQQNNVADSTDIASFMGRKPLAVSEVFKCT